MVGYHGQPKFISNIVHCGSFSIGLGVGKGWLGARVLKSLMASLASLPSGVETASHAGHCPINLVNVQ